MHTSDKQFVLGHRTPDEHFLRFDEGAFLKKCLSRSLEAENKTFVGSIVNDSTKHDTAVIIVLLVELFEVTRFLVFVCVILLLGSQFSVSVHRLQPKVDIDSPCITHYLPVATNQRVSRRKEHWFVIMTEEGREFANSFIGYLNESCTAFHAIQSTSELLVAAGFERIYENKEWNLCVAGKYFFTRNATSTIAFTVGGAYKPGNGFTILGAHSDSPCLKIKAVTCHKKGEALMLNTQPYGGGLWHTWFDRDLGLAGRIVTEEDGALKTKLVRIDKPIARIPNLAIHLTSGTERESFAPNLQEHGKAILSMDPSLVDMKTEQTDGNVVRLHPALLQMIAIEANIPQEKIVDLELQLIDVQPSTIGGASGDLIFSGRLDNLCSSYQCMRAIIDGSSDELINQPNIRMAMMFDHEEVGSSSCAGAGSSMFMDTLRLINDCLTDKSHGVFMRSLRQSLVVSIDMAHALHPNYSGKHDPTMAPKINGGLVIKHNANQRYATNPISASMFRQFGKLAGIPVQEFSVKSDSGCGSTIGPIISTLSGILTVDCGSPQFSMHSIRETMGSEDPYIGYVHLKSTLKHHPHYASKMESN